MGNQTKRQKRLLRDFITGLSGCAVIAVILIGASFINREEHIPVVFSDILDGAKVTAGTGNEEIPEISLEKEYLYETLFGIETIILTSDETITCSTTTGYEPQGAGGTILINTTEKTTPKPETTPVETTTTPVSTTISTTETKKTSVTTNATATTKASTTTTKPSTSISTSKTPFTNIGGGVVSEDEEVYKDMLKLVNKARKEHGLNELWYSARVHEVATMRAEELSSYYSHTRIDGRGFYTAFLDKNLSYWAVGENIAYGRNMFKTVEEVFEAWMDSPSHRDNILSPDFECAGFGLAILKVGPDTYYYWSQEFATFR